MVWYSHLFKNFPQFVVIYTVKASGGDGIPVELFQILKDDAVKVLHSICGLGRSARNEGDRFLQLASLAAQETGLCFLRLEKWTKTVKAVEVGRNHHQGI